MIRAMDSLWIGVSGTGMRIRLWMTGALARLGFGEHAFLLPLAVLIGIVSAAAAVAFHELIHVIRNALYEHLFRPEVLYGRGVWLLVLLPAAGGLLVGLFSTYLMRQREGHGIIDVMETVMRSSGYIRPTVAIEKILTAALTIGSGGSAGAEGPIVQIGAGISSAVGQLFQVTRAHLPVLIGCGAAAGISAIFSSPIGGVLFTLEVILLDFSIRAFTPIVVASFVGYVTTQAIFHHIDPLGSHAAIFSAAQGLADVPSLLDLRSVPATLVLGVGCGFAGVMLTRLMYYSEEAIHHLPIPRAMRPAMGGAAVGIMGVAYVTVFGWLLLGTQKPFAFHQYPMPAFFGDGYGVIEALIGKDFYLHHAAGELAALLVILCVAKIFGTCLTLSSGGSGGIIAPSLFLGATTGALLGLGLRAVDLDMGLGPGFYALIGMGAVLAAVVHAPLASILILSDVTGKHEVILPAMLACVAATGTARLVFKDSVYTLYLRQRGIQLGGGGDLSLLRRLTVEQVDLEPVASIDVRDPLEKLLELTSTSGATDFVALEEDGLYAGMVTADDLKTALLQREAIPLLTVGEMIRPELPCVANTADLASVLDTFSKYEVARLPVCLSHNPGRIIGLVSRRALMQRYQKALNGG